MGSINYKAFLHCPLSKQCPVDKSQQHRKFGNAQIQTRGCWARSANTTYVLCASPPPLLTFALDNALAFCRNFVGKCDSVCCEVGTNLYSTKFLSLQKLTFLFFPHCSNSKVSAATTILKLQANVGLEKTQVRAWRPGPEKSLEWLRLYPRKYPGLHKFCQSLAGNMLDNKIKT